MAKSTNGLGKFSGKLGGSVFAIRNGLQIVREKPVVVANPKTIAQRLQRAKGNLVGQVSKITPYQILEGLGDNRSNRRARFLRIALNNTTAVVDATDSSKILAKLDAPGFVFSEGALIPVVFAGVSTASSQSVTLNLGRQTGISDTDFLSSGTLVVATILSSDGRYEFVSYRFVSHSEFEGQASRIVTLNHNVDTAYQAGIYIAPFRTTDGSSLRVKTEQIYGENADFNASMISNPAAMPLVWGNSIFVRVADFTPAP